MLDAPLCQGDVKARAAAPFTQTKAYHDTARRHLLEAAAGGHVPARQFVEKGKLPWRGTHMLRKTCGTRIADGGGGVSAVATHLRHKSLQTASRYIDRRGTGSRALNALES